MVSAARLYSTNAVTTASPQQLVLMMYDAALAALSNARIACGRPAADLGRLPVINKNLIKVNQILIELRKNLDYGPNPDFADLLNRLYSYYIRRCLEANRNHDSSIIGEVERLLAELRNAWAEALRRPEVGSETNLPAGTWSTS